MPVYSETRVQIEEKAQILAFLFDEVPTEILAKYFDYNSVFLLENAAELLKIFEINEYTIKLKKGK